MIIKNEIYYSFKDLIKHPFLFLVLSLQMLISFYLLFYGVHSSINTKTQSIKIENLINEKNGYYLFQNTNDQTLLNSFDIKKNEDKLQDFYNFLNNNEKFKLINTQMCDLPVSGTNNFSDFDDEICKKDSHGFKSLPALFTNKHFKNVFNIECENGDFFEESDFSYDGKTVPIVLGNKFNKVLKVGNVLKVSDTGLNFFPDEGREIEFVVKGFLKKESCFLKFNNGNNLVFLDKMIIFPLHTDVYRSPMFEHSYSDLDERISGFDIVTDDINNSFKEINEFGSKHVAHTYSTFYAWKDYFQDILKINFDRSLSAYFLAFSIAIFAAVNIVLAMFILIEKSKQKIAIKLLCGCTIGHIVAGFVTNIAFSVFLGLIIEMIIVFDFLASFIVFVFGVIVISIIVLPIANKIKNTDISIIIKNEG
ncbi:MAG: hypothetical protein LBF33_00515 [Oscillospiraceae bacterium]|jgi:hypothetical protein|nr:hypothetical protein [Oscillospiraceae bacterium]